MFEYVYRCVLLFADAKPRGNPPFNIGMEKKEKKTCVKEVKKKKQHVNGARTADKKKFPDETIISNKTFGIWYDIKLPNILRIIKVS